MHHSLKVNQIKRLEIFRYLDAKDKKEEVDMKFYQIDEKIAGLVKKSKQTGVPYGILKKSYDRGMVWIGKVDIIQALLHNNGHLQE